MQTRLTPTPTAAPLPSRDWKNDPKVQEARRRATVGTIHDLCVDSQYAADCTFLRRIDAYGEVVACAAVAQPGAPTRETAADGEVLRSYSFDCPICRTHVDGVRAAKKSRLGPLAQPMPTDTARLDWLEAQHAGFFAGLWNPTDHWCVVEQYTCECSVVGAGLSLREAIDAAVWRRAQQ